MRQLTLRNVWQMLMLLMCQTAADPDYRGVDMTLKTAAAAQECLYGTETNNVHPSKHVNLFDTDESSSNEFSKALLSRQKASIVGYFRPKLYLSILTLHLGFVSI